MSKRESAIVTLQANGKTWEHVVNGERKDVLVFARTVAKRGRKVVVQFASEGSPVRVVA